MSPVRGGPGSRRSYRWTSTTPTIPTHSRPSSWSTEYYARVNDRGWQPNSIGAFTHDSYMAHVNFGHLRNLADFAPRRAPTCGALERERTFLTSTYPSPSFLGVEIRRMGERCVHVTNRRWHWGGRRPPNPPDAPHMTHHPDVPRDRSHRRGLASREGVRYIAFSLHGDGTSRWSRGRLEDSPSGLWRTLGKRVGCKPSGVRIPHPPPQFPLRSRDSRACELTEAHSDVACLRSLWSVPRRRERVAPRESTPPNSFAARRRAPAQTQHIGNRPDRTGERGRTAPMASRSRPALDSFPQYRYSRGSASSSGAVPPAASGRFRPAPPCRRAVEKRPI